MNLILGQINRSISSKKREEIVPLHVDQVLYLVLDYVLTAISLKDILKDLKSCHLSIVPEICFSDLLCKHLL